MRTRESLTALIEGWLSSPEGRSDLVKLTMRLILKEALEAEVCDALGRDYYERGAEEGRGYRNGHPPPTGPTRSPKFPAVLELDPRLLACWFSGVDPKDEISCLSNSLSGVGLTAPRCRMTLEQPLDRLQDVPLGLHIHPTD